MGGVGNGHALLTPLRLHGRDVEDEVSVLDAAARGGGAADLAVLAECVADPADFQVVLGNLYLAAHGASLAGILAVWVRIVGFEEDLILLTFSKKQNKVID